MSVRCGHLLGYFLRSIASKFPVTFSVVTALTVLLTLPSKLSSSTSTGMVSNVLACNVRVYVSLGWFPIQSSIHFNFQDHRNCSKSTKTTISIVCCRSRVRSLSFFTRLLPRFAPRMVSAATLWDSASCNTNSLRVSTDFQLWSSYIQRWYWAIIASFNFLHKLAYNVTTSLFKVNYSNIQ